MVRAAKRAQGKAPDEAGEAAFRAFQRIAELWQLSVEDQLVLLGGVARSTYYHWRSAGARQLPRDTVERLSYVLGIYKALQILLPDPAQADGWIHRANAARPFGGSTALERMLGGQVVDLFVVRQYLDAQLGGWPS